MDEDGDEVVVSRRGGGAFGISVWIEKEIERQIVQRRDDDPLHALCASST